MILKGRKVTLRAIERKDLELLVELVNDPETEKMIVGYAPPISYEQEEQWFQKNIVNTDTFRWIIETQKDGAVGMISADDIDWKNRVVHTTGIRIDSKKVTEAGVALDAMMTMFKYLFDELNMNRIEGGYIEYNKNAEALCKMVGYTVEGLFRDAIYKNGKYHNYIPVAILKADFEKKKNRKNRQCMDENEN